MPYGAVDKQYQEWQWNEETAQISRKNKWCMEVSASTIDSVSVNPTWN